MASNTINQGAVNGIVIKPIWGTLDKQEEEDSVDRFIAIVDSIKSLLDTKANINHNHDDRYYTEPEIDTKLLAIDVEISQINSKLTPMYGYCETAASVAAKTVTITNFTLVTGRTVYIKFEHENSADDPTLNINGTGAIRIVRYGTSPVSEQEIQWSDGEVKCFTYDGISWIESGGAGGGSDRSDTISFHGSDMIVEPGTNRITFDDSDMIIHPPDGAAWIERTMEALEGGISIISTNNEHAAISNGQYVYIRMHETLPDGLYKATDDIAQNAELSALNVISAAGALNDKSNIGHTHDDRYYTESEIDTKLNGKANSSHTHDDRYYTESETNTKLNEKLNLSGGTMTGTITLASTGLKTHHADGYTTDQYGNFKHSSSTANNYFNFFNNAGTSMVKIYWETGKITCATPAAGTNNTEVATTAFVNTERYFKKGDTYSQTGMVLPGMTTSGNTSLKIGLLLPKYVTGRTVTITSLSGSLRGKNGYVDSCTNGTNLLSKYTCAIQNPNGNYVTLNITSSSAFGNIDNNNVLVLWGDVSLSFS